MIRQTETISGTNANFLPSMKNRLADEPSAYLRQHTDNPVYWQPWDKQALDLALSTDKPILLSIGYSACHWCHVMAEECFQDPEVAALMNEHFINIKVDREERPDIDQIYMSALTAMGEQGGWPLTIFLSPHGDAFWGGTYFPKYPNGRLPGFINILNSLADLWNNDRSRLKTNIDALKTHLQSKLIQSSIEIPNEEKTFQRYADTVARRFDQQHGGLAGAPKFPNFPLMSMLWSSSIISGQSNHRELFVTSMEKMLNGGIYDHLAGGLARYSTDEIWLVPHFEKMLYDNAFTIRQALCAYSATKNQLFRIRIEEIIHWLQTEMLLPEGGYASGLNADSEGVEGKFYVWTKDEIDQTLEEKASLFNRTYNVTEKGNWDGKNILNLSDLTKQKTELTPEEVKSLSEGRATLLHLRNQRIRPSLDDKCLTDWNAYTIRALAEAGNLFQCNQWIQFANNAYDSIILRDDQDNLKRLVHTRTKQNKVIPALSQDYAAMINAALTLYQITQRNDYLQDAVKLKEQLDYYHLDDNADYRLTALNSDDVILHLYGDQDEATPSPNSQIIEALMRLALFTDNNELLQTTEKLAERALGRVSRINYGQASILTASVHLLNPVKLILIIPDNQHKFAMIAANHPNPGRVDIILTPQEALQSDQWASFYKDSSYDAVAILCRDNHCLPPIYNEDDLDQALQQ